ncbi:hypothetical protein BC835DRAFT_1409977 [Cytidiella melzeri]|nr:hypothetical protein BC835DRAFT_1409977 [Cytidiella melzeri]
MRSSTTVVLTLLATVGHAFSAPLAYRQLSPDGTPYDSASGNDVDESGASHTTLSVLGIPLFGYSHTKDDPPSAYTTYPPAYSNQGMPQQRRGEPPEVAQLFGYPDQGDDAGTLPRREQPTQLLSSTNAPSTQPSGAQLQARDDKDDLINAWIARSLGLQDRSINDID